MEVADLTSRRVIYERFTPQPPRLSADRPRRLIGRAGARQERWKSPDRGEGA
jgi:hypothetical protein